MKMKMKVLDPPHFFHPNFFYQNDSEWPKMDFKHNFKKREFLFFKASLNGKRKPRISFVCSACVRCGLMFAEKINGNFQDSQVENQIQWSVSFVHNVYLYFLVYFQALGHSFLVHCRVETSRNPD